MTVTSQNEKHIKEGSIEFDPFCGLTEEEKEQLKKDIKPRQGQIIRIQGKCKIPTENITEESK